jgi:hypothetical protein
MKKLKGICLYGLFFTAMFFQSFAFAVEGGFGICTYGKETVPSIICYGPAVLRETTITGDLKVAGPLKASKITVGAMTIAGSVDIQDAKVKGPVDVKGYFSAKNVDFLKDLNIEANEILLNHVKEHGSMTIHSVATKAYLKMRCDTTIAGSVKFDGEEGVVQVTNDSIVQGKIINGTLEFVEENC